MLTFVDTVLLNENITVLQLPPGVFRQASDKDSLKEAADLPFRVESVMLYYFAYWLTVLGTTLPVSMGIIIEYNYICRYRVHCRDPS